MEPTATRRARFRARTPRRNATRRWCIPPAILREPDETLEGTGVLDEVAGEAGLLLWHSLRDVTLWAEVAPGERPALFAPPAAAERLRLLHAAGVEPALEVSLATLAALVANPEGANAEIVTLVCLQISRWAQARGLASTTLAFAQAGALASPDDPGAALSVGVLALHFRRLPRAETWLRRTIGLARRRRDWAPYAQAWVELGRLQTRRGDAEAARRALVKGIRASRRHGLLAIRAAALHGLFLLAMEGREWDEAERFARLATRAYGRGSPRQPELQHDVARLWVHRAAFDRALPALQKLLPTRVQPGERVETLALLARAAAGAGNRMLYQDAWWEAWTLVERGGDDETLARALLEMAEASLLLRDLPRLEQACRQVLRGPLRRVDRAVLARVEVMAAAARPGARP
jgi:tetratricopeptide (TPR) repeat protein